VDAMNTTYDQLVKETLLANPTDLAKVRQIESQRFSARAQIDAQFGPSPPSDTYRYLEQADERWRREDQYMLRDLNETTPQLGQFSTGEEPTTEEWDAFNSAVEEWYRNLPQIALSLPTVVRRVREHIQMGAPESDAVYTVLGDIATPEAIFRYRGRYHTALRGIAEAWEREIYDRAWDSYRRLQGLGVEYDERMTLTVGGIPPMTGAEVAPQVEKLYGPERFTGEEMAEVAGVQFPSGAEVAEARRSPEEKEASAASSMFWDAYYSTGPKNSQQRRNVGQIALVGSILDSENREVMDFTPEQYREAARQIELWKATQDVGDQAEQEIARTLYLTWRAMAESKYGKDIWDIQSAYFDAGPEGSQGRRNFLGAYPRLTEMWDEHGLFTQKYPLYQKYYRPREDDSSTTSSYDPAMAAGLRLLEDDSNFWGVGKFTLPEYREW